MSLVRIGAAVVVVSGLLLSTGCAPKQQPTHVAPPPEVVNPQPRSASDPNARVRDLSHEAENLADDSKKLPGRDAAEHRRLMARVFSDLTQTLPLLQNPVQDRVLAQRITTIQNSRAQLEHGSPDLSIEPTIDAGLRAASAALADLSHSDYYEQADVGPVLDKLSAQINRLDFDRGPLHSVDVAGAVDLTSQIVSKMASVLSDRLAEPKGPSGGQATTQPTTSTASDAK